METMCQALKSLGGEIADLSLPDLGPCKIQTNDDTKPIDDGETADKESDSV